MYSMKPHRKRKSRMKNIWTCSEKTEHYISLHLIAKMITNDLVTFCQDCKMCFIKKLGQEKVRTMAIQSSPPWEFIYFILYMFTLVCINTINQLTILLHVITSCYVSQHFLGQSVRFLAEQLMRLGAHCSFYWPGGLPDAFIVYLSLYLNLYSNVFM